jgi:hypothetical protein
MGNPHNIKITQNERHGFREIYYRNTWRWVMIRDWAWI